MKGRLAVVVGSALLLGGALLCQAHPGGDFLAQEREDRMPPGPFPPFVGRALDLSDAQKGQIEAIMKEARDKEHARRGEAEDLHEKLRQAERAASFDETAVRGIANALAGLDAERLVARIKTHFRISAVLTPAQRTLAERMLPRPGDLPVPRHCRDRGPGREDGPGERPLF
ncbi:hypothetical protein GMST_23060 [Geomonas silvestris]|uniref:Periplasmic heavy metal sensor n=1 Tax=Geomonas silvestris TaxID=2740184 RepID=A0A6V8MJ22_9BACT|nr:Spy/CpxP family protein refolding chaperone [Geomonas silvestris]GFO59981.1 hypothetical protein GMST_23060 [Geomonas silvestris]